MYECKGQNYAKLVSMQVAAFELLQKVLVTITPTHVERIKEYQRRAETCLLDILLRGATSPVSLLASFVFLSE